MLRIGQLAERSGVSVRALRYYEEQGLLEADRTPAGQRAYPESAAEKVRFFQQMYAAGLTNRNIAALLSCMDTGHTDAEQRHMLQQQRDFIQGIGGTVKQERRRGGFRPDDMGRDITGWPGLSDGKADQALPIARHQAADIFLSLRNIRLHQPDAYTRHLDYGCGRNAIHAISPQSGE